MEYESFFDYVRVEGNLFSRAINSSKKIRVISHLDADGLASVSILIKTLLRYNKEFHVSIVKQLDGVIIEKLMTENYTVFVFTDLGSGQLKEVEKLTSKGNVVVIDHHPSEKVADNNSLVEINPHKIGVDGGTEVCSSTLTYFVCKEHYPGAIAHLGVVGSIGDRQTNAEGLLGINKFLLEDKKDIIKFSRGLNVFGRISRPLHYALAYSSIELPGVSGEQSSAIQFLSELGIELKDEDGEWRSFSELSKEEEKRIVTGIAMRRASMGLDPNGIIGNVYTFENKRGILVDGSEFATLLNSCGRQGDYGLGIALCLGEGDNVLEEADSSMVSYKRKLMKILRWVDINKKNGGIIKESEKAIYLLGGDKINDTLIGTVCSILASSGGFEKSLIVGFADSEDGVKVSGRAIDPDTKINVGSAVEIAAKLVGGDGGGHGRAGGAKIEKGKESMFIEEFEKTIKNIKGKIE